MKIPQFKDKSLLTTALTHRSALNECNNKSLTSNERLEYLGDAVLELVVTEFLYDALPDSPEGELTIIRSSLVKAATLSRVGKKLGLGELLYLSKGEENNGGRENDTLLADTLESVIGALYLDQGLEMVKKFIHANILIHFEEIVQNQLYFNAKSLLQEEAQAAGLVTPFYRLMKEEGPDHDKCFTVVVLLGEQELGVGTGKSKQAAQLEAAKIGLKKLRQQLKQDVV